MTTAPLRTAAILATGDEIVGGRTTDTNSGWLADRLAALGIEVVAFLAVSDDVDRIAWAWKEATNRADVVLSTGGLGPTTDDLTNEALAGVFGLPLERNDAEADRIRDFFRARGRMMTDNNLRQAMLPRGAEVVPNPVGTAPGYRLAVTNDRGAASVCIVLPGVPREMKPMAEQTVLPWIAANADPARVVVSRTFSTFGLGESALDERLRALALPPDARLAFRASFPKVSVRVSVAGSGDAPRQRLDEIAAAVRACIADVVYADGDASMEKIVGTLLAERSLRVATAESCTGGLIGSRITDVAGSSDYYSGGVVAYSNDLKQRLLGVRMETLERFGAVSEQTAREMASGILAATGADLAVATTGIAGPGGGTPEKPVGTVAIALAEANTGRANEPATESRLYLFKGDREWVKMLTAQVALDWIRRRLVGLPVLEPQQITPAAPRPAAA